MFVSCAACRPRKCVNPVDFWKVRRFSFAVNLPISYVFKQVSKKRRAQRTKFIVTSLVNVDVFSPSVVLGGVMVGAGCYLYMGDMEYYDNSWAEFDYYLQRGVEGENQYEVYNRLTPQPIQDGPFQSSNSQECTVNAGQYDSLNYSQDDLLMQGNSSVVSSDLQDRAANNDYQYQYFNSTNIPSAKFIDINANTTSQDSRQDGQQPQKLNQNVHDNFYYFDQQRVSNNEVLGENF
eukprot:TRINITY_DN1406_c0_g1_i4.p1 TRINITY_DN1406_c0_g1~~TRINITY_DN1406_c0_g1_i4.p1  ORF type:complete len:253 (+),score=9.44 TRINITY_DN1406_c0_g1_i4:55-759(+)